MSEPIPSGHEAGGASPRPRSGSTATDQGPGTGRVTPGKDGRLEGTSGIKDGHSSGFVAARAEEPDGHIPPPPGCRDKWRRRR